MKPLQLTISGFRSFRAEQTIDFSDLDFFAIVGNTGAGKSSLLEAMVYALYNKTTWSERDVKSLIALDAPAMKVDFTFAVRDGIYTVSRGAWSSARPSVHNLGSGTDPELRAGTEREVNEKILALTGLAYTTFLKTVVLPQGRFAELLTARDSERAKVLAELLDLREVDQLRAALDVPLREVRERCIALTGIVSAHGEDPLGKLEHLRRRLEAETSRAERLAAAFAEAKACRTELAGLEERLQRANLLDRDLVQVRAEASAIVALEDAHQRISAEIATARRIEEEARGRSDLAAASLARLRDDKMDVAGLDVAKDRVDRIGKARLDAAAAEASVSELLASLANFEASIAGAVVAREAATEAERTAHTAASAARDARGTSKKTLDLARDRYRSARAATDEVTTRASAVESGIATGARLEEDLVHRESTAETAKADLQQAEERLVEARRSDLAAQVSQGLHAGEACPVCDRTLTANFVPVRLGDRWIETRSAEQKQAATTERLAVTAAALARDRLAQAKAALEQARDHLANADQRRIEAHRLAKAAGVDAAVDLERSALAVVQSLSDRSEANDEACQERLRAVASTRLECAAALAMLQQQQGQARARLDAEQERIRGHLADAEAESRKLPDGLRPGAGDEAMRASLASIARARVTAQASEREATETNGTAREASKAVAAVIEHYRVTIEAVVRDHSMRAEFLIGRLDAEAKTALPPPVRAGDDFGSALSWTRLLSTWVDDRAAATLEARLALTAHAETARARLAAQLVTVEAGDFESLERMRDEAHRERDVLASRVADAQVNVDAVRTATAELDAKRPHELALDRLRGLLDANRFKEFVMRQREKRLLGIGTEILRKMTNGRFAFAQEFAIVDGHTQRTRSPDTLSGGEKFLASLALALALVEVATRAGGRLDVLFLDEGFGSLDASALDVALAELARQARTGKMIGIITHVRGIAAEIDTILRVQRTPAGSVVHRLDDAERQAMLDDDLASGLLEAAG